MNKRIMLMAGELSGDMHGAFLVRALREQCPDAEFVGIGGNRMKAAGVEIIQDIVGKSTIGFLGNIAVILRNLRSLLFLITKVKKIFSSRKPDVLVLIDNQGLNMFFAQMAKKHGIKLVYYIPPQEWLWGSVAGGQKVVDTVDTVITILEKEYEFYSKLKNNAVYHGHPLLDIIPEHYRINSSALKQPRTIGLFPGSRKQEIRKLSPILRGIAEALYSREQELTFIVAISDQTYAAEVKAAFRDAQFPLEFEESNSYQAISRSQLVVGASGTLALECVILNTPMIVLYKLPRLDYFVAKHVLKIKVDFISLPNIIMGERVLPEFIQDQIRYDQIAETALQLVNNEAYRAEFARKAAKVNEHLGTPGVLAKVARTVLEC